MERSYTIYPEPSTLERRSSVTVGLCHSYRENTLKVLKSRPVLIILCTLVVIECLCVLAELMVDLQTIRLRFENEESEVKKFVEFLQKSYPGKFKGNHNVPLEALLQELRGSKITWCQHPKAPVTCNCSCKNETETQSAMDEFITPSRQRRDAEIDEVDDKSLSDFVEHSTDNLRTSTYESVPVISDMQRLPVVYNTDDEQLESTLNGKDINENTVTSNGIQNSQNMNPLSNKINGGDLSYSRDNINSQVTTNKDVLLVKNFRYSNSPIINRVGENNVDDVKYVDIDSVILDIPTDSSSHFTNGKQLQSNVKSVIHSTVVNSDTHFVDSDILNDNARRRERTINNKITNDVQNRRFPFYCKRKHTIKPSSHKHKRVSYDKHLTADTDYVKGSQSNVDNRQYNDVHVFNVDYKNNPDDRKAVLSRGKHRANIRTNIMHSTLHHGMIKRNVVPIIDIKGYLRTPTNAKTLSVLPYHFAKMRRNFVDYRKQFLKDEYVSNKSINANNKVLFATNPKIDKRKLRKSRLKLRKHSLHAAIRDKMVKYSTMLGDNYARTYIGSDRHGEKPTHANTIDLENYVRAGNGNNRGQKKLTHTDTIDLDNYFTHVLSDNRIPALTTNLIPDFVPRTTPHNVKNSEFTFLHRNIRSAAIETEIIEPTSRNNLAKNQTVFVIQIHNSKDNFYIMGYIFPEAVNSSFHREKQINSTKKLLRKVTKGLHFGSMSILAIMVVEAIIKMLCRGKEFFKKKMEVFDAFIVIASFLLDFVFQDSRWYETGKDAATILVLLLPWRVIRIVNSFLMTMNHKHKIEMMTIQRARKKAENKLLKLQSLVGEIQRDVELLAVLCRNRGIAEDDISACIYGKGRLGTTMTAISSFASLMLISTLGKDGMSYEGIYHKMIKDALNDPSDDEKKTEKSGRWSRRKQPSQDRKLASLERKQTTYDREDSRRKSRGLRKTPSVLSNGHRKARDVYFVCNGHQQANTSTLATTNENLRTETGMANSASFSDYQSIMAAIDSATEITYL